MVSLYLSATQAVIVPPSVPLYPSAALHEAMSVDPVAATVPELSGQSLHAAAPVVSLYLSAMQAVIVPPSVPLYPPAALHDAMSVEPVVVPVPLLAGQAVGVSPLAP